jgi:hypothetical protein
MALQKLTKEKESAARELQMSMAAQQGQGAGTIKDQLQQKALGMTKQELEKQQMALLQQKQQEQQKNLQQIAQTGIAQNPAPNMEAAPGFASGGIIAFAGPEGSQVPNPLEEKLKTENLELNKGIRTAYSPEVQEYVSQKRTTDIAASNAKQRQVPSYMQDMVRATNQGAFPTPTPPAEAPINVSSGASGFPMTPSPGIPSALPQRQGAPSQAAQAAQAQTQARPRPAAPPAARPAEAPINISTGASGFPMTPAPGAPAERPAQQPAPQEAGLAALPQAAQAAPSLTGIQAASPQDEGGKLKPEDSTIAAVAARKIMSTLNGTENPKTAAQEIREGLKSEYALTEEEKADRKNYQASLRARHAALTNPEELRRERLKQTLLGMAGASNSGIALARGAAAGQNYEAGRNAEALKVLGDLNDIGEKEISARRAGALKGFELGNQEGQNVRTSSTAAQGQAMNALVNMMGYDARSSDAKRELESRERVAAAEIAARKDIAGWDNKTKMDVVNATNQMHREVQEMSGQVSRDVANIHGRYQLQGHNISAGATMGAAQLGRTTQLEKAIIDNRARLVNIEERAMNAIDAAAAKERATITALVPSTGPNAAQKKQLEAIDSGAAALKADLRARMNQQISDVGLENVLGPNLLGSGSGGKYIVTKEPTK